MSTPYLGQISTFGFNFAPSGWALCNGQTLSISQNTALFSLLGTTYGGNGTTTFQLPNLQGLVPLSPNNTSLFQGATGGEASHTLVATEMPAHSHLLNASGAAATANTAIGNYPAAQTTDPYSSVAPVTTLGVSTGAAGGAQSHSNMQPYLVITFCIALEGIYPSRS